MVALIAIMLPVFAFAQDTGGVMTGGNMTGGIIDVMGGN